MKNRSGRTGAAKSLVVLLVGFGILAASSWFAWSAFFSQNSALIERIPELDSKLLSARSIKLFDSCEASVHLNPTDPSAWGLLGRAHLAHQFPESAFKCFEIASELEPDNFEWYYCQALAVPTDRGAEAIKLVEKAIENADDPELLQCKLAEMQFEEGDFAGSRKTLDEVIKVNSGNPRANMLLARLYLMDNQLDDALKSANLVNVAQANRKETLELLSQIYVRLGKSDEANRFAEAAEQEGVFNEPWYDPVYDKIVALRRDVGRAVEDALKLPPAMIKKKIEVLEEAVAEEPQETQWHVILGQTLLKIRNYDKAAEVLKNGLAIHPDSAVLHYTLGLVLLNQKKIKEAIGVLENTVRLKQDYVGAFRDLGIAYRQDQQFDKAIKSFQKSLELLPDNLKTQLNLAVTLEEAGKYREAANAYRECLRLDPTAADVSFLLGKLLAEKLKDAGEARRYLKQAINLNPGLVEAQTLLESLD